MRLVLDRVGIAVLLVASSSACCLNSLLGADEKIDVPARSEFEAGLQQVRTVFASRYQEARTSLDRDELAWRLLAHARNTGTLVNDRYAALREALAVAIDAGAVLSVLTTLDELDTQFTVDLQQERLEALDELRQSLRIPEQRREFVDRVSLLVEQAFTDSQFAEAAALSNLMIAPARGAGDNALFRRIAARNNELDEIAEAFIASSDAIAGSAESAADPETRLIAGRFLCFYQGDWGKGLPLLADSSDEVLQALARESLSEALDSDALSDLGDRWWDVSRAETGVARSRIEAKATEFYIQVIDSLTGGARARVQRRIDDVADAGLLTDREQALLTPEQVISIFELDPEIWKVQGDELHGRVRAEAGDVRHFFAEQRVNTASFEFGFRIKSPQYHLIAARRGDEIYEYSRGHWSNTGGLFRSPAGGIEQRDERELVREPEQWHSIQVRLERGNLLYFYDGLPVAQTRLETGGRGAGLQLGFGSYMASLAIKDLYLMTGR